MSIKPRYEYRVWARELDRVATALDAHSECVETLKSVETYLLGLGDIRANPKVRRGALEVKMLDGLRDGFELWGREVNELFPVDVDVVADLLFGRLGLEPFGLRRDTYSLPQLLEDVVEPCSQLTAVEVSKTRRAYVIDGCLAEVADVTVAGNELQTASVESTDLPPLRRVRSALHLDRWSNTCYPSAIRTAVGSPQG